MPQPRKTIAELKLLGTYRKDRHADRANCPPPLGKPRRPRGLNPDELWLWDHAIRPLVRRGIVGLQDVPAALVLCHWWSQFRRATHDGDDPLARAAFDRYERTASKFGLTPADRKRLVGQSVTPDQAAKVKFFGS